MSTSLLYHAFGIRGYDHINTKFAGGAVILTTRPKVFELQCSSCRSRKVILRGVVNRKLSQLKRATELVKFLAAEGRVCKFRYEVCRN